jgi:acyl-CoA reductase-like NAD-dependent aldehyde dehydrogenase
MSDDATESQREAETTAESDAAVEAAAESEPEAEAVVDIEAAAEREDAVEALREQVREQREQIEELEGLLTDLSARVADGNDAGVCPDCHGPVVKMSRWLRPSTIECQRCGRVFHRY